MNKVKLNDNNEDDNIHYMLVDLMKNVMYHQQEKNIFKLKTNLYIYEKCRRHFKCFVIDRVDYQQ